MKLEAKTESFVAMALTYIIWSYLRLYGNKLECFPMSVTSTQVKYFNAILKPTRVKSLVGIHPQGKLSAFLGACTIKLLTGVIYRFS